MRQAQEAAAIVLAEEIRRRAAGPDHLAFDAVTWRDLGRILQAIERRTVMLEYLIEEQRDVARAALPLALSAYTTPGWLP